MANKGKWTIPLAEVPNDNVIHQYILNKTDLKNKMALFDDYKAPDYVAAPLSFDHQRLQKATSNAIEIYGLHKFSYQSQTNRSIGYESASLTWNPLAIDRIAEDPHMATLGSSLLGHGSAAHYEKKLTARNTYHDTYAFRERTPFSNHEAIKELLSSFARTLVRSRVSSIVAGRAESTKLDFCWHNDESIFINLRVNIPVQTTPNYVIQILTGDSGADFDLTEIELKNNYAYVYDTQKFHRPFCKKLDSVDRINIICGVSPWFDFDQQSQAWVSNEYYGEMHPFEMFANGHVSSLIKKN